MITVKLRGLRMAYFPNLFEGSGDQCFLGSDILFYEFWYSLLKKLVGFQINNTMEKGYN